MDFIPKKVLEISRLKKNIYSSVIMSKKHLTVGNFNADLEVHVLDLYLQYLVLPPVVHYKAPLIHLYYGHGSTTPNKLGVILVKRPKFLHSPAQVAGPCRLPFLAMILKPDDYSVTKVLHIAQFCHGYVPKSVYLGLLH